MTAKNEAIIPLALRQSLIDTMKVQLSTDVQVASLAVKVSGAEAASSSLDILSVMEVNATGLHGSVALGCTQAVFLKILEVMIGEKHAAVTPENADACGELLNIIYASARVKINEAGFDFQPAIPTTVSGSRISLPLGQYSSFIKFTAESPHGPLTLALALKRAE